MNFDKQMAQSPLPATEEEDRRVTEEKANSGRESTAENEVLSGDIRLPEEKTAGDDREKRRRRQGQR